jgi:hypothetical protein
MSHAFRSAAWSSEPNGGRPGPAARAGLPGEGPRLGRRAQHRRARDRRRRIELSRRLACHRCGHRWRAEVNQRTKRLTRCQRCHTERADGRNSLAAVHPELVAEWDATANRPLRPERLKATYDKAVVWRCLTDAAHPPYRMSPATRAKRTVGCPLHRMMRQRGPREASRAACDTGDARRERRIMVERHVGRRSIRTVAPGGLGPAKPAHRWPLISSRPGPADSDTSLYQPAMAHRPAPAA